MAVERGTTKASWTLSTEISSTFFCKGRQTNALVAKRLGTAPSVVLERVRRLDSEGAILGYRADVAPEALGVGLQAFVIAELEAHHRYHIEGFAGGIGGVPGVRACYHVAGRGDYLLHVAVQDLAHLERLLRNDIAAIPGAARLKTLLVLKEVKKGAGWPTFPDDR